MKRRKKRPARVKPKKKSGSKKKKPGGLLGRYLLQSLTHRTSQKGRQRSRSLNASPSSKVTRLKSVGFFQLKLPQDPPEVVLVTQATPVINQVAPTTTEIAPLPHSLPHPQRVLVDESVGVRWLLTTELLRPQNDLKQSIEGFLLDQRSPHTRRAYGKDLKRFIQFLLVRNQDRGAEKIDRLLVIAYKDSLLNERLEHTTVDRHLATLRSFFRWLVDDGKIEKSPVEGVRFLNPKRMSSTLGFTDEEVRRVLGVPNRHSRTGAMHHAILSVLFYCGLRRSELCDLRTTHVGTERNHPVLRLRGKGNAERLIVIPPKAWDSLNHYLAISRKELREDQFLFNPMRNNRGGGVTNKPLNPSMIFYIVTKYAKLAGVANRVSPHSCRATAISNARDHQVSDRAIQEFAGWASPDMITRYDKRRNAVENSASLAIHYENEKKEDT